MTDNIDHETGEVLEPKGNEPGGYALDGRPIPAAAATGGDIINMLEEGQFSQDLHRAFADLIAQLNDVSEATSGKAKGSVAIKIDIVKEDNALRIASNFKITAPPLPRARSIMWTDQQNNLTMFPPNQMQMFGMKSIGGNGGLRRA